MNILKDPLAPNTAGNLVLVFCAAQFIFWILVPGFTHQNPPLDVVEAFTWGETLQWGYHKHPPLQAALLELALAITGNPSWSAYILSQIALALTYTAVWLLGRRILGEAGAGIGVLLLFGIYYFQFPTPEFNPNILQLPLWSWSAYFLHCAWKDDEQRSWYALGIVTALNMYTKYSAGILLIPILLFLLTDEQGRKQLRTFTPWVALGISFLLFVPHLYWLVSNDFISFSYAVGRTKSTGELIDHIYYPTKFLLAQVAYHGGFLLAIAILFGWGTRNINGESTRSPVNASTRDRKFLLIIGMGPLIIALLISAIFGWKFKDMWGTPMFTLSGLLVVSFWNPTPTKQFGQRFIAVIASLAILSLGSYAILQFFGPFIRDKPGKGHFPSRVAAQTLGQEWQVRYNASPRIFVGDAWVAGNLALYSEPRASVLIDGNLKYSPWVSMEEIEQYGAIIVWQKGRGRQPHLASGYVDPDIVERGQLSIPWQTKADISPLVLEWVMIPPGTVLTLE